MNRRQFIRDTLAASGVGLFTTGAAGSASKGKVPLATLGRTGQRVSRLGVGCGIYIRGNLTRRDMEVILETALDAGINYVDTAPAYKDVQAQIGPVVRRIRDRIFLVSKVEECTYEGAWRQLRQSLKDLQTDRLDLVHLHSLGSVERWPDLKTAFSNKGALGALREAKRQGVIRFIGASGHNYPSRFHAALDTGDIDVLMNAVNFIVRHSLDFEHKLWSRAHQENIGLVAIKILGGAKAESKGFRLPEDLYEQALRYALSVPGVCTAVIGFEDPAQVEEAVQVMSQFKLLSEQEMFSLYRRGLELLVETPYWKAPWGEPVT